MSEHLACQISDWYVYFCQTYSANILSVDDVIFLTAILTTSRLRTEIKMTFFLESGDQTGSETHIFYSKITIRKFTLCDLGLTRSFSVEDLHGARLQNGFDFWILREKVTINHVLRARKRIFDSAGPSWSFLTWPWPWLILGITLMLTGYLQ